MEPRNVVFDLFSNLNISDNWASLCYAQTALGLCSSYLLNVNFRFFHIYLFTSPIDISARKYGVILYIVDIIQISKSVAYVYRIKQV